MRWAVALATVGIVAVAAIGFTAPRGDGASWDDAGADGHSRLARALADERPVRIMESTLAILPPDAGRGDVLFLFPTHRPATDAEVERVHDFVLDGGLLVVAADGSNAASWAGALGVEFKGLPAILPPGEERDCVPAPVVYQQIVYDVCLPSPTTFPNLDRLAGGQVAFTHVALTGTPVFLDADQDGKLSPGDQGPVASPVVLQWDRGAAGGRVVAVADGDVWRNEILTENPGNLDLARALAASAPGHIYLDSSGVQPTYLDRATNPFYRLLAGPTTIGDAALALGLLATALATTLVPRATPLRLHDPPQNATDPDVERAAARMIHAHIDAAQRRPSGPPSRRQEPEPGQAAS